MGSALGATALVGALSPLLVSAQTPPANQPGVACAVRVEGPAGVAGPKDDFAAQLAKALGKTQAEVEQALAQVRAQFAVERENRPGGGEMMIMLPDATALAPAAAQLGVTPEELAAAMRAALPAPPPGAPGFGIASASAPAPGTAPANVTAPPCPPEPGQPGGGAVRVEPPKPEALFQAIADHLGRGITAAQVRAALESLRPSGDTVTVRVLPNDRFLEALAQALGVTVDQLKAALQSIVPPLPPPPPGR
jgi:hypothetical protein